MKRFILDTLVTAILGVAIAAAVLLVGTGALADESQSIRSSSSAPRDDDRRDERGTASHWIPSPLGFQQGCRVTAVLPKANSGIHGKAVLCPITDGIRLALGAENLTAGDVYTAWFAYFDRASSCHAAVCTVDDALGDNPTGVITRLDGGVVQTRSGLFRADLRDLRLSLGSQVVLILVAHGPASTGDNRFLARQLLTLQSPRLGAPVAGALTDGETGSIHAYAAFELRSDP